MSERERPYFKLGIEELEALYASHHDDIKIVDEIYFELSFRSRPRAAQLREDIEARLAQRLATSGAANDTDENLDEEPEHVIAEAADADRGEDTSDPSEPPNAATEPWAEDLPAANDEDDEQNSAAPDANKTRPSCPPITNSPESILSAWVALEVLTPQTFDRPERLANDTRGSIAHFEDDPMPWDRPREPGFPSYKRYYQIVLGSITMPLAVQRLVKVYADKRPDGARARGEAPLAAIVVDAKGRLVEETPPTIASFGWGLPIALAGDLSTLSTWREHETRLNDELLLRLTRTDEEGESIPLDRRTIDAAYSWLVDELRIDGDLLRAPRFAVRAFQYYKSNDPPESLLLNSFYLEDLQIARVLFRKDQAPDMLKRYLGAARPGRQINLLRDDDALAKCIEPMNIPLARWPGKGRHALSLLQQTAVNLAGPVTETSQILAVNGPPGTGKTTLLRDVVAARVTERAKAMCAFADPETAFQFSQLRLRTGQAWTTLYRLHESLRGHEIVVASTNNKAVENVSAELPMASAVAEDAELRYFRTLSDNLLGDGTWGAVAAVLGNAKNRARFYNKFWWDKDFGLMTYLMNATGTPRLFERHDEDGQLIESRLPRIVTDEQGPRNRQEAMTRWTEARRRFAAALKRSEAGSNGAEDLRKAIVALPRALVMAAAAEKAAELAQALVGQWERRPGFWARFFRFKSYKAWLVETDTLTDHVVRAADIARLDRSLSDGLASHGARGRALLAKTAVARAAIHRREASDIAATVSDGRKRLGHRIVDDSFFKLSHDDRQVLPPWFSDEDHKVRDALFKAALDVHKAFIDAAAKPLRNNLSAFLTALGGRSLGSPEKDAMIAHVWSSLFLVVPVVSTTFASVFRMLGLLPPKSLGWLLVDEAGQAIPQAAVGALMRARRTVIVGDPMQIEPVVTMPDTLTGAICRHYGVDPDLYDAPAASVQTLADAATPYSADFESQQGTRTVGVPLLVHRRCQEPMFSISNAIAYERMMVFATPSRSSPIRDTLGPSRWIHVQGGDYERWCPEEGEVVVDLLAQLRRAGVKPDIYIVAPFVMVAEGLRRSIIDARVLHGWIEGDPRLWTYERVGTVHTVQGREAEGVIFVLGAQSPARTGARNWAGARPNLLNVAVTRAQEALYVVGNRDLWKSAGLFSQLHARMP
ncbi:MAG: DEAD/DEAH box helicase [Hyphomonadaceae bacterium]